MDIKKPISVLMAIMFFLALIMPALATVSVQEIRVTGGNRATDLVFTWVTKDTNASGTSDMNFEIFYGTLTTNNDRNQGGILIIDDQNAYTHCTPKPTDFTLDSNCTYTHSSTKNIPADTYYANIKVAEIQGTNFVNSDANTDSNAFVINNALTTSSVLSLVATVSIVLVAAMIVLLITGILLARYGGFEVAQILPALVGVLVTLIVIALLYAVLAGT